MEHALLGSAAPYDFLFENFEIDFVRRRVEEQSAWALESILSWDEAYTIPMQDFLATHYWTASGAVNTQLVVGSENVNYVGYSWLDLLETGERMRSNLGLLKSNPGYYRNLIGDGPSIHFNTLDGLRFFVGSNGLHRACIAKFYLAEQDMAELHGVSINHYQLRHDFYRCYKDLQSLILSLNLDAELYPKRTLIKREDGAGWKLDHYSTELIWHDFKSGVLESLDFENARQLLIDLHRLSSQEPSPQVRSGWQSWLPFLGRGR